MHKCKCIFLPGHFNLFKTCWNTHKHKETHMQANKRFLKQLLPETHFLFQKQQLHAIVKWLWNNESPREFALWNWTEITPATFSILKSNLATWIMQQLSHYKAATGAWSLIVVLLNTRANKEKLINSFIGACLQIACHLRVWYITVCGSE